MGEFPRCPKCGGIINYGMSSCPSCNSSGKYKAAKVSKIDTVRTRKKYFLGNVQFVIAVFAVFFLVLSMFMPFVKIPIRGDISILSGSDPVVLVSWIIMVALLILGVVKRSSGVALFIGVCGMFDSVFRVYQKNAILNNMISDISKDAGSDMFSQMAVGVATTIGNNVKFGAGFYFSIIAFMMLIFAGTYQRQANCTEEFYTGYSPFARIVIIMLIGILVAIAAMFLVFKYA